MDEVEIEIITHKGFEEWEDAQKRGLKTTKVCGRHEFIYKRLGNEISLAELKGIEDWFWEIYCIKGTIFKGVEVFHSKQEAEDRIIALLTPEEKL